MQDGARKNYGPTGWRLVAASVVFGEAHLAAVELGVEVDRYGKAAMRGQRRRVVPMRSEMSPVLCRIAADDISLHAGDRHEEKLLDLGRHPLLHALLENADEPLVRNGEVLAALERGVDDLDRLPLLRHHKAGLRAAVGVAELDELPAQLRLQDVGQNEYRRGNLEAGEPFRPRQAPDEVEHGLVLVVGRAEREHREDMQRRVDHHPEATEWRRCAGGRALRRPGAIEARHALVEIPEEADARQAVADAPSGFV